MSVGNISNAGEANETIDAWNAKSKQKARERQEGRSLADEILNARERETVTLELAGQDVEFRIMLGETRDEVEDIRQEVERLAAEAEDADEDDDVEDVLGMTEDEALEQVESIRDRFIVLLVEHATDDSLTREFWLQAYGRDGAGRIAMRLKRQSERADMTEEELRQFRNV